MARCDICGTIIPIGENRCPNCGQRIKKDNKTITEKTEYMKQFTPKQPIQRKSGKVYQEPTAGNEKYKKIVAVIGALVAIGGLILDYVEFPSTHLEEVFPVEEAVSEPAYDYRNYDSVEGLATDYPNLVSLVEPYRDYTVQLIDTNENIPSNVSPTYFESITVVNGELESAKFYGYITESEKNMDIEIEVSNFADQWEMTLFDGYDGLNPITQEEFENFDYAVVDYMAQVIDIEKSEIRKVFDEFLDSIPNYFRSMGLQTEVGDIMMNFEYDGEGVFRYSLSKPLDLE